MSVQTKNRYLNSFFLTTILYLVASFFLFYVFADTIIVEEKKPEEIKISIKHMMTQQEPTPVQQTQSIIEPEPLVDIPTPVKKRVDKPREKKHEHHKMVHEEKRYLKEKVVEKMEITQPQIQTFSDAKPVEQTPKRIDNSEIDNIESIYLTKLRNAIEKNKNYPKTAKRLNQTGKVHVTFIITKDGKIKNCKVLKGSNFESLDQAALEILLNIANFEPIPNELNKESWEITVPIIYQIS